MYFTYYNNLISVAILLPSSEDRLMVWFYFLPLNDYINIMMSFYVYALYDDIVDKSLGQQFLFFYKTGYNF